MSPRNGRGEMASDRGWGTEWIREMLPTVFAILQQVLGRGRWDGIRHTRDFEPLEIPGH